LNLSTGEVPLHYELFFLAFFSTLSQHVWQLDQTPRVILWSKVQLVVSVQHLLVCMLLETCRKCASLKLPVQKIYRDLLVAIYIVGKIIKWTLIAPTLLRFVKFDQAYWLYNLTLVSETQKMSGAVNIMRILADKVSSLFHYQASVNCFRWIVGSLLNILTLRHALFLELDHCKSAKYFLKF
jgi:hypothetical protein